MTDAVLDFVKFVVGVTVGTSVVVGAVALLAKHGRGVWTWVSTELEERRETFMREAIAAELAPVVHMGSHIEEMVTKDVIPRLKKVEEQVLPNGGESMADRVRQIQLAFEGHRAHTAEELMRAMREREKLWEHLGRRSPQSRTRGEDGEYRLIIEGEERNGPD